MTSAAIRRRNLLNAQNSTGPKSSTGKAVSSQNARRHGATGRADPARVLKLMEVILDAPGLDITALYSSDAKISAARDLAVTEVRQEKTETALRDFEAGRGRLEDLPSMTYRAIQLALDCFEFGFPRQTTAEEFLDAMVMLERIAAQEMKFGGKRHRLLRRYHREAQTRRSRALKAWIKVNKGGR